MTTIANGSVVSFDYTLRDGAGSVIDSSQGGAPMVYLHGHGNIVAGLEEALHGKTAGTIELALDADEETAVAAAKALDSVGRHLAGKSVAKVIYKAGKILNLIVR